MDSWRHGGWEVDDTYERLEMNYWGGAKRGGLSKDFAFGCFVVYFVCAVELRHTDEMMVSVDNGFGGCGWVVHILNFEAVEEFEDALGAVEVVINWDSLSQLRA